MPNNVENRELVFEALREELVGPSPQGEALDCEGDIHFENAEKFFQPYRQSGTGEEILQRDPPCKRYGVGVLYPLCMMMEDEGQGVPGGNANAIGDDSAERMSENPPEEERPKLERVMEKSEGAKEDPENDDFDLSSANRYLPSSMGLSFLAEIGEGYQLIVEATGGRYEPKAVSYFAKERIERRWWLRRPVSLRAVFDGTALSSGKACRIDPVEFEISGNGPVDAKVEVFSRPHGKEGKRIVTVCLVNRSTEEQKANEYSLFQCHFRASVVSPSGSRHVLPYPGIPHSKMDKEEQSLSLLYREFQTYAIGHGCAADWQRPAGSKRAEYVTAECLPRIEVPNMAADVTREDGTILSISMRSLAGLNGEDNGFDEIAELIQLYEKWISGEDAKTQGLASEYQDAAKRNLSLCRRCVERMKDGLDFLASDALARKAFQLANHAILLQQARSSRDPRRATYDSKKKKLTFSKAYAQPNLDEIPDGKGYWRAFQIAFILASIRSSVQGDDPERATVELIWFPTGGGKTEAYLGLAAFTMFLRRLRDPLDHGVQVIMRYTLRLLTAQQFQRASALICAMEYLRSTQPEFGDVPFSIGIWLGAANTPNTRADARRALRELNKSGARTENPFVITKCPWCNAEMGPVETKLPKGMKALGYLREEDTVVLRCPDTLCHFADGLPTFVIDEDIYKLRPSLVIGTVDKFATLAWREEPRFLFGIDVDGKRFSSPPGLIIQDELHLISGPLGSMVGLYELVIEELCTDRRNGHIPPKIVSSTATIRRYVEQIRSLYGRTAVDLFPPPGLSSGDSFFSSYATDRVSGKLLPGKIYVGVHAPGLGSMQTVQVRSFSALLQAPMALPKEERDPWWTLMLFFNSLRELGTTLSLFQSDIPDYFGVLRNRSGNHWKDMRLLRRELELTSRLRNDEIPRAIEELEKTFGAEEGLPVDTCLSSSIIEVGIDIDRLSLMCVVGQPKSTSQYIQVTGRVGRRWHERPGLVVTLYGASKSRDRSHFEQFRSYHERLYAQVEPTSVTPFSRPTLERALHGAMVAYVRQTGDENVTASPYPCPEELLNSFGELFARRVDIVDPNDAQIARRVFAHKQEHWKRSHSTEWLGPPTLENAPLTVFAGSHVPSVWRELTWETPTSMRNVDAECQVAITKLYIREQEVDE